MTKLIGTTIAVLAASLALAHAEVSKGVQKAFRGEILISAEPLPPPSDSDKETIAAYKKARVKSLKHAAGSEGVPEWTFHLTAFMTKAPKLKSLSVDFHTDDKEKLFVANKQLTSISPDVTILSTSFTMSEDDNLNKGKSYLVKLTGEVKGKEVVFASAKLKLE